MNTQHSAGKLPMTLQFFAEDDAEPSLLEDDLLEPANLEPEAPAADEPLSDSPELTEEPTEEPGQKRVDPDDSTPWVKKRLARAERSFERKFLEEAAALSEGVTVEREEIPKAARLWNVLKYNTELSNAVDKIIKDYERDGKLRDLRDAKPDAKYNEISSRLELKEAQLDMRYSDPIFKKYEQQITDWAEDEGLELTSSKALKIAYRAWKGEHANLLMADAEKKGQQKASQNAQARKSAALAGGRTPVASAPVDYAKASDKDILTSLGLKLFTDDY